MRPLWPSFVFFTSQPRFGVPERKAATSEVTLKLTQPERSLVWSTLAVGAAAKLPPFHCAAQSGCELDRLVSLGQLQVAPVSVHGAVRRWTSTVRPWVPQLRPFSWTCSSSDAETSVAPASAVDR